MLENITKYFKLVRFAHTVFCLPFALCGFFLGISPSFGGGEFTWVLLLQVLGCMVCARNTAMGFNRWLDRDVDALNPRTKDREIPAGKISPRAGLVFVIINALLFVAITFFINRMVFFLSPVALFVVMFYSYCKRFTSLCHIVLGCGMALAPLGAYLAVTAEWALLPVLYFFLVLTWGGGFDIIYSLQDQGFDSDAKLHSIPQALGTKGALRLSSVLHVVTAILVVAIGYLQGSGTFFAIGACMFLMLLYRQHAIVKPDDLSRINLAFGTFNGIASILFSLFDILDIVLK
ncbi:MAG: putative 4-hydroxybenzoate polyprenyltransferase [Bacteroidales bacterium]|nr:putative 4-hydroxybenzoate polyprenyltransferase [Bacteroidales bacterium]